MNYAVGLGPTSITVGDFNGDGKLDLAIANAGSSNVSLLLGNGDGTFQMAADYSAGWVRSLWPQRTSTVMASSTWQALMGTATTFQY